MLPCKEKPTRKLKYNFWAWPQRGARGPPQPRSAGCCSHQPLPPRFPAAGRPEWALRAPAPAVLGSRAWPATPSRSSGPQPTGRSWCSRGQSNGNPSAVYPERRPSPGKRRCLRGNRKPVVTPGDPFPNAGESKLRGAA